MDKKGTISALFLGEVGLNIVLISMHETEFKRRKVVATFSQLGGLRLDP
jgi:hypothetical protein